VFNSWEICGHSLIEAQWMICCRSCIFFKYFYSLGCGLVLWWLI